MITPSFSPTATERVLPKLALDFTTASLDSRVTFTRTTDATHPATYTNNSGVIASATNNQPRFDYDPTALTCKGLLIEESRTNSIRNNTNQGASSGTPGNVPSNWEFVVNTTTGLTTSVDSVGQESGIYYVDLRLSGTASGSGSVDIIFETANGIPALTGQTWAYSFYSKLVSGSFTGLSSPLFYVFEYNSGSGFVAANSKSITFPTSSSLITQRQSNAIALTGGATTAYARPLIKINIQDLASIDVTLRIGMPQFELGAFATSVIPTTTTALTRNADVATMTGYGVVDQGTFVIDATVVSGKTLITSGSVTFAATASTAQKTAVAYNVTSVKKSIDAQTVTSAAGATASVDISIGPSSDGYFRKMFFYLPKLTDAELQSFSK